MNIFEKLDNKKLPEVNNGSAKDVPDFFDEIIKKQFSNKETIKKIHQSLVEYVNDKDSTFFVRLYGSYGKNMYHLQRRGFLSKFKDNTRVVFCDNTFSLLFTGMKLTGNSYTSNDLKKLFNQDKLIVGFGQVADERELSYYKLKGAKRAYINAKGWYQAHVKPVGKEYEGFNLKELFPNPDRYEFDNKEKIRYVDKNLSGDQLHVLKAHFLRLIHPFNSFLVPKRNRLIYKGHTGKPNIGEEAELINYVSDYIKKSFPSEYKEFDELTIKIKVEETKSKITEIKWFDKAKTIDIPSPTPKSEEDKNIDIESFEESLEINLEKTLKSIGKKVFAVILFPELSKNINVKHSEIAERNNLFKDYAITTQKSRLSSARTIFRKGMEKEALENIYLSKKIDKETKKIISNIIKD